MVTDSSATGLGSWESFYVIVGGASGALIGLQFVVITLLSDLRSRRTPEAVGAFATPTVVHFAGVLLLSAVMSVPWASVSTMAIALAACGIVGTGYAIRVGIRARRQSTYPPGWEDWLWYVALPWLAYVALLLAALLVRERFDRAVDGVAAVAIALLFIGIHNAWDTVTYIVVAAPPKETDRGATEG
jgi:cytochrome bd-type quinol oxidase subunit 2